MTNLKLRDLLIQRLLSCFSYLKHLAKLLVNNTLSRYDFSLVEKNTSASLLLPQLPFSPFKYVELEN